MQPSKKDGIPQIEFPGTLFHAEQDGFGRTLKIDARRRAQNMKQLGIGDDRDEAQAEKGVYPPEGRIKGFGGGGGKTPLKNKPTKDQFPQAG
jgi:hypothetical protein